MIVILLAGVSDQAFLFLTQSKVACVPYIRRAVRYAMKADYAGGPLLLLHSCTKEATTLGSLNLLPLSY